ncbi:MAG: MBL fold metallo-hydrolase, partial [Acidobacteria bacterium]|nr:MBL fold metallo-hydrolase [Acidobacteriota bacterium]
MAERSTWPDTIDLMFLGRPRKIATGVVATPAGVLLVDPGPASCLGRLEQALADMGIGPPDLHGLLLTHIHLDHAGATGTLVRRYPHLKVFVHERGAPHLVDPSKLLASAQRLYGADMDRLWGEFAVVPAGNVYVPKDGEVLSFGGAAIDVASTRGHASHHLCYHDRRSGTVFAGDTGGIRVGESPYVLPPTPPPDIDLPAWRESLARLRAWQPAAVFVTHFGLFRDAAVHLDALAQELEAVGRLTHDLMTGEPDTAI